MKWLCSSLSAAVLLIATACCSTSGESGGTAPTGEGAGGAAPAGKNYSIDVRAPATAPVGQEATTEVVVTPLNGYKINLLFPAKLILEGVPAGTKVSSKRITKREMRVEEKRLTVPVRFIPEGPGEKTFQGELRFSVCDKQSCQMPREAISWKTRAEGAAPPPGEAGAGDGGAPTIGADGGPAEGASRGTAEP